MKTTTKNKIAAGVKPFVFVLMPFTPQFDDIYKLGIKATCETLNTYCERVDEQIFEENILERIYNQIAKADIIISDLSEKNPNVFYETGYAHALGKKVILLTQKTEDIPFDLKHYPHIIYDGKIIKLKAELEKRIDWFIRHPDNINLPNESGLELFMNGVKLETGCTIRVEEKHSFEISYKYHSKSGIKLKIDVLNNSNHVYNSEFRLGFIVRYELTKNSDRDDQRVIKLNSEEYLHLTPDFSKIFPSAWISYEMTLLSDVHQEFSGTKVPLIIRLFTEFGVKDYAITVDYVMSPIEF